jgi:nitric oxide dioxygenase
MTPQDIQLVKSTWAQVLPVQHVAAQLFYRRLFELAPQVRPMFKRDVGEQGAMLMATLNTVVGSLDRLEQVLPVAQRLAMGHVAYGVRPEHYDTVGEALLWTLRQGLGESATDAAMTAWATAYGLLASAMKAAAYPSSTASAAAPPLSVTPAKAGPDPEWQAQALMQAGAG